MPGPFGTRPPPMPPAQYHNSSAVIPENFQNYFGGGRAALVRPGQHGHGYASAFDQTPANPYDHSQGPRQGALLLEQPADYLKVDSGPPKRASDSAPRPSQYSNAAQLLFHRAQRSQQRPSRLRNRRAARTYQPQPPSGARDAAARLGSTIQSRSSTGSSFPLSQMSTEPIQQTCNLPFNPPMNSVVAQSSGFSASSATQSATGGQQHGTSQTQSQTLHSS